MNYRGWALFIDSDIILEDVDNLFALADEKYAVMCVQHDYKPKPGLKMDGQLQTVYPRKNWSSVVLWNCGHPSNEKVTVDSVNNPNNDGAYFHRFSWLNDNEIVNYLAIGTVSWLVWKGRWFSKSFTLHRRWSMV